MKNRILKISSVVLLVVICGLMTMGDTFALVDTPWGPKRKTFTWADPATYATFNSIIDNPSIGDERNFVRVREVKDGEKFGDSVNVVPGKKYEVYIYYHNNADGHEVGKTAIGIADGAAVKSSFPATIKAGEKATVTATVFASDTNPLAVWDGAYMVATQDLYLRYVPGSAKIHNGGALNGSNIGPDYLFGKGALLGYNKFSGVLPGCSEYAGHITYQLFADAPGFNVKKSLVNGSTIVQAGDKLTFKIRYDNTGTMDQKKVVMRDTLPDGLEYIKGSAKLYNNNLKDGKVVNDDVIDKNGMNIGDYAGGSGWAELVYDVKVKKGVTCETNLVNKVEVSTTDGNKKDEVRLTVSGCAVDNKVIPKELPETGPAEIVMAVVVILGIGGAGYYLYRTRKTLRTVEGKATGEMNKEVKKEDEGSQKPDNMIE